MILKKEPGPARVWIQFENIHFFIQHMCVSYLLHARACVRTWGTHCDQILIGPCPHSVREREHIQGVHK